jgi:hypothetical protein
MFSRPKIKSELVTVKPRVPRELQRLVNTYTDMKSKNVVRDVTSRRPPVVVVMPKKSKFLPVGQFGLLESPLAALFALETAKPATKKLDCTVESVLRRVGSCAVQSCTCFSEFSVDKRPKFSFLNDFLRHFAFQISLHSSCKYFFLALHRHQQRLFHQIDSLRMPKQWHWSKCGLLLALHLNLTLFLIVFDLFSPILISYKQFLLRFCFQFFKFCPLHISMPKQC